MMLDDINPEVVTLPARDFMDAAEVISWIGSRTALPKHMWWKDLFRFSRDWRFDDWIGIRTEDPPRVTLFGDEWFSSADQLLSTFKARASGSIWPHYPLITTAEGRDHAEQYLARFDISDSIGWTLLGQQLMADIRRRDQCLEKLRAAAGKLRRELYKGSLIAWGSKVTDGLSNDHPRQKISSDEWPPGVEIDLDGEVRETVGWDRDPR
jgi:hypothetical protein